ncbi:LOW QUALITY PROTEIN: reverse transcriptase [Phytophthora megakarya]|uniref:Reverse transcriptase n=1 Tax=Phytophthora megakarya TaxID=4795 RepID=A0A225VPF8_9STRA|nr:LOW QUALITY PROTEIN: reverse transcriptase [Phytophthora megakarya]
MFCIIIIPVSKVGIKGSVALTIGSGIIFAGEGCTERYVGECVDCETGKGRPRIQSESPGNLQATYPFQIIAMDHIPSLPRSYKGNTELLIFEDLFSGYVIAKASGSRTAQTVAESYEECVFRRFGASEVIRHDREPGFMSDFFRAFNKILDQRQRATMAYRPQTNGLVQTTTRALKMYVQDLDQRDWDEYVEVGSRVWLYLDRVREGNAMKLAHLWHGPFRVAEKIGDYAVKLEIAGSAYYIFPIVHVAKIKPVRGFLDRPVIRLVTQDQDRLDFDEAPFPEIAGSKIAIRTSMMSRRSRT